MLEPVQVPPRPHENLLHDVLGILDRPEHPVTMHLQLALERADQSFERQLIARPGQRHEPRRVRRRRAVLTAARPGKGCPARAGAVGHQPSPG